MLYQTYKTNIILNILMTIKIEITLFNIYVYNNYFIFLNNFIIYLSNTTLIVSFYLE